MHYAISTVVILVEIPIQLLHTIAKLESRNKHNRHLIYRMDAG